MINNRTDKIRLLKCLIVGTFILIFIGLIITSGSLAQWPPYNDYGGFPDSFFNPTLSLSNSPYTNSFTSSSFPSFEFRGLENYGTDVIYGNSPYNNSSFPFYDNSYMPLFSPSPALSYPFQGGLYAGPTGYNPFSFNFNPYSTFLYPNIASSSLPWSPINVTAPNIWLPSVVPPYNPFNPFPSPNQYIPSAPAQTVNIEAEEYFVYSALIEEKYPYDDLTISDHTSGWEVGFNYLDEHFEGVERKTFDNYEAKNAKDYTLKDNFTLTTDYELIDGDSDDAYFALNLSRVGFNLYKNQAIVYGGRTSAPLAGIGSIFFLIKENGVWKVESQIMAWIS